MRSPRVVVGFHHFGHVAGKFAYSLARAVAYEGGRILSVVELPSPYTDQARNQIVERFLLTDAQYLLMVDADIEFEKDAISKTMWVAQNFNADVVWGNYALGNFANSLFSRDDKSDYAVAMFNLNPNMVYENVYCGGTGWCLSDRRILEKLKTSLAPDPWPWFGRDMVSGTGDQEGKTVRLGEDMTFGKRVFYAGGKQVGYTGIFLVHHKMQPMVPHFMSDIATELGTAVHEMNTGAGGNGTPAGMRLVEREKDVAGGDASPAVEGAGDAGLQPKSPSNGRCELGEGQLTLPLG